MGLQLAAVDASAAHAVTIPDEGLAFIRGPASTIMRAATGIISGFRVRTPFSDKHYLCAVGPCSSFSRLHPCGLLEFWAVVHGRPMNPVRRI